MLSPYHHRSARRALLQSLLVALVCSQALANVRDEATLSAEFESWTVQNNRQYGSLPEEQNKRFQIWREKDDLIQKHNSQDPPPSYTLGHNQFSDRTEAEIAQWKGTTTHDIPNAEVDSKVKTSLFSSRLRGVNLSDETPPDEVDWVARGAVTSVKNQGSCGACWAFSAAAVMETLVFQHTGQLKNLSVQEMVDCDTKSLGCGGAKVSEAYRFIEKNGGLVEFDAYPYVENQQTCRTKAGSNNITEVNAPKVKGSQVTKYRHVASSTDSSGLMRAVVQQPVSVSIRSGAPEFIQYSGGFYDGPCGDHIDHAVTVVGYGTDTATGKEYWHIKNSWHTTWGDDGYMKLDRETINKCSILEQAVFPIYDELDWFFTYGHYAYNLCGFLGTAFNSVFGYLTVLSVTFLAQFNYVDNGAPFL